MGVHVEQPQTLSMRVDANRGMRHGVMLSPRAVTLPLPPVYRDIAADLFNVAQHRQPTLRPSFQLTLSHR